MSLLNSSYAPSTFARVSVLGERMNSVFFIWGYGESCSIMEMTFTYMHEYYKRDFLYVKVSDNFFIRVHITLYRDETISWPLSVKLRLTQVMIRCCKFILIFSRADLSSSHSGYHFAQKRRTIILSDYRSWMVSIYCIVDSFTSLLFVREYIGMIPAPFTYYYSKYDILEWLTSDIFA